MVAAVVSGSGEPGGDGRGNVVSSSKRIDTAPFEEIYTDDKGVIFDLATKL